LVRSIRGAGGGYVLAKPPSDILASEIVQALEGPFMPVDCLLDVSLCENTDHCVAREIWHEVGDAVRNVLASYTIEQIAAKQKAMEKQANMFHI
ncbi:MAG: Rrf2 family transcriptional regulator, partial [Deltaproteobacteria bacterium]|nr:Rrf2 family transcriptional regulator [Deltaproteobacteria bacterium]